MDGKGRTVVFPYALQGLSPSDDDEKPRRGYQYPAPAHVS